MGWSIGYDRKRKRFIGYGVPALCDFPECNTEIDRGLAYVCCDEEPFGGEAGCGLFFCGPHTVPSLIHRHICVQCSMGEDAFPPKPDVPRWTLHMWEVRVGALESSPLLHIQFGPGFKTATNI